MRKVEIGIYRDYKRYFALGISGYKMREIKNEDKYCLAFVIRNKLNKKGIEHCFIRPFENNDERYYSAIKSELEAIANTMSFNSNKEDLNIKINEEIYIKK